MIKITTQPADNPLFGQSKWWGQPDMPEELEYPEITLVDDDGEEYQDPLTFVCQLRCEELAPLDPEGLLPHGGMLWFFAALDYFLGDMDSPAYPGLGPWQQKYFRVLYSPKCDDLHTHSIVYDDGTPVGLPAEAISFSQCDESGDGIRLLGEPYIEEVREEMPGRMSLLQIDEDDRWNLIFHDCGMLNFLITPDDLHNRRWDKVECYLFSF
ncbi:MAG: DUF1963 domain-containing protein [Bacteroidales bacterium]|nr:DUF1963 domain-containing protein [Bacteroidales bacterium]